MTKKDDKPEQSEETAIQVPAGNAPSIQALQEECERLRQTLAEVEAERAQYREMFFAFIRQELTAGDRAELDHRAREVLDKGGHDLEALIQQLELSPSV